VTSPLATVLALDALWSLITALALVALPSPWHEPVWLAALMALHLAFALRVLPVTRRCAVGTRRAVGRAVVIARLGLAMGTVWHLGPWGDGGDSLGVAWLWAALVGLSCAAAAYAWVRSPARRP